MIGSVFTDPQHAQLDIHDFNTDPYYCLCSFLFPIELEHEWLGIELDISGDLSSQWAPHPSLGVPFYTSHKAKLFAITYRSAHPPFTLLLPLSTVLSHVYAIQTDRTCIVAISRDIPWELWGSNGTRLAQLTHLSYTWIRRAFGQQFVQGARTALDPVHFEVVRLYDLNQWSLKHALSSVNAGDKHNTQILLKATALDGDNFSPPITTSFPCRIRFVELKLDFQAMMMHEDGFIAVSVSKEPLPNAVVSLIACFACSTVERIFICLLFNIFATQFTLGSWMWRQLIVYHTPQLSYLHGRVA